MSDTTAKWAIPRPELADDPPDVPRDFVAAMNRVDDLLTPLSRGLIGARPPAGKLGQRYVATDQDNQEYLDTGTEWIPLNITRGFSPGDVKASFQTVDHGDWKLIDGRNNILRSSVSQEYVDLALARGWVGSDGTRIGVPDGIGRILVNRGIHADIDALGDNDGEAAANRRVRHKHAVNEPNGGQGHAHGYLDPGHFHLFSGQREDVAGDGSGVAPKFNTGQGINATAWATETATTNITITRSVTGITIGPQAASPVDGPAFLTVNFFIYTGATVSGVTGGGEVGPGSITTDDLADGAVTSPKIADGTIVPADLAFDPATQAELDAVAGGVGAPNVQVANYILALADAGKAVEANAAGNINVTVPPNADVAFPIGTVIEVLRYGAGTVTIVAGAGVTIRSRGGLLAIGNQYGSVSLRKRAANEWVLNGDLA